MRSDLNRRLPLLLAGIAVAIGLCIALWPRSPGPKPPPSITASAAVPEPSAPTVEPDDYEPDLSGPDVGEVVVPTAESVTALSIVGERLVWLLTERAELGSARLDGGEPVTLFASDDKEAFGGAMATSSSGAWWSVELAGDDPEPIYFAPAAALVAPRAAEEPVVRGSSPDHLTAVEARLFFADLGHVLVLDGNKSRKLEREQRIATMASDGERVCWIEVPYTGGDSRVACTPVGGGEAEVRIASLPPRDRDMLTAHRDRLWWAEDDAARPAIMTLAPGASAPVEACATGTVTAVAHDDRELFFAEVHGEEDAAVSVLRALSFESGAVRRLGRDRGHVTAIAVGERHLFWAGSAGIKRLAR